MKCSVCFATNTKAQLINNVDAYYSTDAGQFAMIESVTTKDKTVEFEFGKSIALAPIK